MPKKIGGMVSGLVIQTSAMLSGRLARHQTASVLLVVGPSGCGKSTLARGLAERAEELGAAVVLESVYSPDRGVADGIVPMLARHLRCVGLGGEQLSERVGRWVRAEAPGEERLIDGLVGLFDADDTGETGSLPERGEFVRIVAQVLLVLR